MPSYREDVKLGYKNIVDYHVNDRKMMQITYAECRWSIYQSVVDERTLKKLNEMQLQNKYIAWSYFSFYLFIFGCAESSLLRQVGVGVGGRLLFVAVCRLLFAVASLVAEHRI